MGLECSFCGYECAHPVMALNPAAAIPCKKCKGTGRGQTIKGNALMNNAPGNNTYPCFTCGGHGKLVNPMEISQ